MKPLYCTIIICQSEISTFIQDKKHINEILTFNCFHHAVLQLILIIENRNKMTAESNDNQEKTTETNNNKVLHVVGENDELVRWGVKTFY